METAFLLNILQAIFVFVVTIPFAFARVEGDENTKLWAYCLAWAVKIGAPSLAIIFFVIPLIRDLPYIISGDYCYVEGVVIEESLNNTEKGVVVIRDDQTENTIRIDVKNKSLSLGDRAIVKYLPNQEIGVVVKEKNMKGDKVSSKETETEQMEKIALMEVLLSALLIITFILGKKKKTWMVYPEIGIYKRLMLIIGGCIVAVIILYLKAEETILKWSVYMAALVVLLFTTGMLYQRMGIRKDGNTLVIVPMVGKKRKISADEINQIVYKKEDCVDIVTDGEIILQITDQFHGYEELRDISRKNAEECQQ